MPKQLCFSPTFHRNTSTATAPGQLRKLKSRWNTRGEGNKVLTGLQGGEKALSPASTSLIGSSSGHSARDWPPPAHLKSGEGFPLNKAFPYLQKLPARQTSITV